MYFTLFGHKWSVELLLLIGVVYFVLVSSTLGGCSNYTLTEGLEMLQKGTTSSVSSTPSATSVSSSAPSATQSGVGGGVSPTEVVASKKGTSKEGFSLQNAAPYGENKDGDEMFMFAHTEFKHECCPSTYSNSQGCACMTNAQNRAIASRFGNN